MESIREEEHSSLHSPLILSGNINRGIEYKKNGNISLLEAYSDADYVSDLKIRNSTIGNIFCR